MRQGIRAEQMRGEHEGKAGAGSESGFGRSFGSWLFAFLVGVDGKEHVVIEAVPAMISALAEVEIEFGAFGKPEGKILFRKRNGTVFHELVFAEKLNLGHGLDHFSFDANDLELVGGDPCASFQIDGVLLGADAVAVHTIRAIGTLTEVDEPTGLSVPVAEAFAGEVEGVAHVGMKDER